MHSPTRRFPLRRQFRSTRHSAHITRKKAQRSLHDGPSVRPSNAWLGEPQDQTRLLLSHFGAPACHASSQASKPDHGNERRRRNARALTGLDAFSACACDHAIFDMPDLE